MPGKDKKEKEYQTLNVVLPLDLHERLRKCAFETRKSLSQICREGLEIILKKYEKQLTE